MTCTVSMSQHQETSLRSTSEVCYDTHAVDNSFGIASQFTTQNTGFAIPFYCTCVPKRAGEKNIQYSHIFPSSCYSYYALVEFG